MYEPGINEFLALKAQVDPSCLLRNAFLRRTFGDILGLHYPHETLRAQAGRRHCGDIWGRCLDCEKTLWLGCGPMVVT
jgi:hypothetical protein